VLRPLWSAGTASLIFCFYLVSVSEKKPAAEASECGKEAGYAREHLQDTALVLCNPIVNRTRTIEPAMACRQPVLYRCQFLEVFHMVRDNENEIAS
jgi:hypothetical protein